MRETIDILAAWRNAKSNREPAILVTVINTEGSTYRRAGARMLLTEGGKTAGSVSGGCLEADLVDTAWTRTENGPAIVTFDASSDEDALWGYGLGCKGAVTVLLQRLPEDGGPLQGIEQALTRPNPGFLATTIEPGPDLASWRIEEAEKPNDQTTFRQRIARPQPLAIFGGGHDAVPLAELAAHLGWSATIADHRPAYAKQERFPHARIVLARPQDALEAINSEAQPIVLMTHTYTVDLEILELLKDSNTPYIGILGPRTRSERLLSDLAIKGLKITPEFISKLHYPVGLDIGAEEPTEVALSIISEIQMTLRAKSGTPLRLVPGPLH